MRSGKTVHLLILFISFGLLTGICAESTEKSDAFLFPFKLQFELHELKTLKFRLTGYNLKTCLPGLSPLRVVILGADTYAPEKAAGSYDKKNRTERYYFDFGFSSLFLTAGPVAVYGLLREINNPLSYSPWSSVAAEKTKLGLDGSFPVTTGTSVYRRVKHGISLAVFPDALNLFMYRKGGLFYKRLPGGLPIGLSGDLPVELPDGYSNESREVFPLHAGIIAHLNLFPGIFFNHDDLAGNAELLMSLTEPYNSEFYRSGIVSSKNPWYLDKIPFPGEKLYHIASSFSLKHKKFRTHLSVSVSGGELAAPGFLGHGFAAWENKLTKLGIFGGFCSPAYRDSAGSVNNDMLNYKVDLELMSPQRGGLILNYKNTLKQPGFSAGPFMEGWESATCKISLITLVKRGTEFVYSMEAEKRFEYSGDGSVLEEDLLSAAVSLHGETGDSQYDVKLRFNILSKILSLNYNSGGTGLRIKITDILKDAPAVDVSYNSSIYLKNYRMYWRVKTVKPAGIDFFNFAGIRDWFFKYFSVSLGWATE
ncbi:MAG: hypothetical protein GXP33_08290 [Spirochaetes bacterium]|nr:hypothetical protein [Spirochaetota bacterium]